MKVNEGFRRPSPYQKVACHLFHWMFRLDCVRLCPMRLDENEIQAIKGSILECDPLCEIYLFGSRTDINKRGGDIDILILSQILTSSDKIPILSRIFEKIEEQKIDIVIAKDTSDPFVRLALKTGIKL